MKVEYMPFEISTIDSPGGKHVVVGYVFEDVLGTHLTNDGYVITHLNTGALIAVFETQDWLYIAIGKLLEMMDWNFQASQYNDLADELMAVKIAIWDWRKQGLCKLAPDSYDQEVMDMCRAVAKRQGMDLI